MIASKQIIEEELHSMKKKKILVAALTLSLALVVAVGGTLAFLSDNTKTLTNTFSVGPGYVPEDPEDPDSHQGLWLDEIDWDGDEGDRIEEGGNDYTGLLPGSKVTKDPTFHMTAGSVKSRVVMKIVGLDTLNNNRFTISYGPITYDPDGAISPTALNVGESGETWQKIANLDGSTENLDATLDGYYLYNEAVDAATSNEQVDLEPLFNYIELDKNVNDEAFAGIQKVIVGHQIKVGGVATQWDNTTVDDTLAEAKELLKNIAAPTPAEP